MRRYSATLQRLGMPQAARRFYDVHVEADAVHERVAQEHLVSGLLRDDPRAAADVLFGARCLTLVEGRFADHLRAAWRTGRSSLLGPLASPIRCTAPGFVGRPARA
jgi:hypothetical protein